MNRKLIAVDVDGTLLTPHGELTSFTVEVLKKLIQQGHLVMLASGRPYRSIQPFYERLDLKGPVICYNGALIFNPSDPAYPRYERRFQKEDIREISLQISPRLLMMESESFDTLYRLKDDSFLEKYFPSHGIKTVMGPLEKTLDEDPFTAIFSTKPEDEDELKDIIESHRDIRFRKWRGVFYSEAFLSGVDKGSALMVVEKQMGLTPADVIAFGDSDNDFEMLKEAQTSFALKGCKSPLLADYFPATEKGNDQDGVAFQLTKLDL